MPNANIPIMLYPLAAVVYFRGDNITSEYTIGPVYLMSSLVRFVTLKFLRRARLTFCDC